MRVNLFKSENEIFYLALEEIFEQFNENLFFEDFDFIIFAVSPKYDPVDINPTIQKIFNTKKYLAFNAINAFSNIEVGSGVVALFIKFEKEGKINIISDIKTISNNNNNNVNVILVPFNPEHCVCDVVTDIKKPVIGGICSGDEAYIYYDNVIEKDKPVILEFENVEYQFGISLGYKPIGPTYKVQVVKNNKVYVIDYEDASLIAKHLLNNTDGNITNLWYSPLLVVSDKSGYVDVVRTFKDIKDNEYVEFFGKIPKNSHVKLSFANNDMLIKEDERVAREIKQNLAPELVLNFSCVARQFILEEKEKEENITYSKILNAPVFGFFTYGEIGPNYHHTSAKLYNQSSLIVALKEK